MLPFIAGAIAGVAVVVAVQKRKEITSMHKVLLVKQHQI